MRLIDADALPIKRLEPGKTVNSAFTVVWNSAAEIIEKAPTIDAVPVVRCADCVFYRETLNWDGTQYMACHLNTESDFCDCVQRGQDE